MQHELIHQAQWLHRDPELHGGRSYTPTALGRKRSTQAYLGNFDEIEAMAHDAAMELRFFYPEYHPFEILDRDFALGVQTIPTIRQYVSTFKTMQHPAMRRFFKKLYQWIPLVVVQRPVTYRIAP